MVISRYPSSTFGLFMSSLISSLQPFVHLSTYWCFDRYIYWSISRYASTEISIFIDRNLVHQHISINRFVGWNWTQVAIVLYCVQFLHFLVILTNDFTRHLLFYVLLRSGGLQPLFRSSWTTRWRRIYWKLCYSFLRREFGFQILHTYLNLRCQVLSFGERHDCSGGGWFAKSVSRSRMKHHAESTRELSQGAQDLSICKLRRKGLHSWGCLPAEPHPALPERAAQHAETSARMLLRHL